MFVITFLLYFANTQMEKGFENMSENYSIQDNINMPTNQENIIIDSNISGDSKLESSVTNIQEISLVSICSIFFIFTIIWGIIFAKFQQKRKKKRLNSRKEKAKYKD